MNAKELDQQAVACAENYQRAEVALLEAIQKLDATRGYRELGYRSLFEYAVKRLKLSENIALNFISVSRKAARVPELEAEIQSGALSVSKARKITAVIESGNAKEWIEKAKALSCRAQEKEVARVAPFNTHAERLRYLSDTRVQLSLVLEEKILLCLKRVQDLECQRQGKAVSLEVTLAALSEFYLGRHDPLEKAKRARPTRNVNKLPVTGQARQSRALPAALTHAITQRDHAQCTAHNADGSRCADRRWLHRHHVTPVSQGGPNIPENLRTLCATHHRLAHQT